MRPHLHWKQFLFEREALQEPWPLQSFVAFRQDSIELKQLGKRRGRVVFFLYVEGFSKERSGIDGRMRSRGSSSGSWRLVRDMVEAAS